MKTITVSRSCAANKALRLNIRRLYASNHLVSDHACVINSSLCIEIQATGETPFKKMIRVYVDTDDSKTIYLFALADYLCIHQPLVETAVEYVTVLKKRHQFVEVLPFVPSHTDDLNLLIHSDLPNEYENLIFRSDQGTSKSSKAKEVTEILSCKNIVDDWSPNTTVITPKATYQTNVAMPGGAA
ncbi:hypothetical protein HC248_01397 [Polaromonas vacuolata]|uniref:Uncharacterized protein n=1 Tax=Polaromonas vacuolata TaxID=37448 RepID=A0A6H2H8A7_9BURK|nr:hypothetical protein [Polaromonas vacuolata]QJC56111.1 hypothetical protein HC248_01397 [Polaromonas vacuolata]